MKEVVFINRKSKILNWFTKHKLDEDQYEKLINSCANNYEDIYENGTPENYLYRPCALQVQEMYSRGDNQLIKKLFYTLLKHSNNSKDINNRNRIDKCISDLQEGKFSFSSRSFPGLIIYPKKNKYFSEITISVESVGDSFFRIIFNCYFSDDFNYKLWLASNTNFVPEINICISLKGLLFNSKSGLSSKKESLRKLELKSYKSVKSIIKGIAPGIFNGILKEFPVTLVSALHKNENIYIFGGYKFFDSKKDTLFFDSIIDSLSNHNSRYISDKSMGVFIPISGETSTKNIMFMKHFYDDDIFSPPTFNLSWYSILHFLLYYQLKLLTDIKNKYFSYDIRGKKVKFGKDKLKINAISSIILILKSQYNNNVKDIQNHSTKYFDKTYNEPVNYCIEYKKRIDYLFERINSEMETVNSIYEDRYAMNNDRKNISLQVMAIVLTLVTITQPIIQCEIDSSKESDELEKKENIIKKIDNNFEHLEKLLKEINNENTEILKKLFDKYNTEEQDKQNSKSEVDK